MTAITSSAAASGSLTGAGSTLVAPLMNEWAFDFNSRYSVSVNYSAVGSGAGISDISSRSVDFGASDAPMTPTQAAGCNRCVQIPWALTATAVGTNTGVKRLQLSPSVVAQIYLGQITNWNDRRIKALNKHKRLPNLKITPIYRSDGSGDTYAFTDLLGRVNSSWRSRVGTATSVSFPAGVGGKGNSGVTALLQSTRGGIAYVAASYLILHGLESSVAALENNAGNFEYPNVTNIEAAAQVVKSVPSSNEMHIVNPPKRATIAYPLSTFTYVIVPLASNQRALLTDFIKYAVTIGQKFDLALDFAKIPTVVYNAAQRTIAQFQQA